METQLITFLAWHSKSSLACCSTESLELNWVPFCCLCQLLKRLTFVSSPLSHRDSVTFGSLHFKAFFTPGHTVGHMIFLLDGKPVGSPSSLFSGDLVFLAGCGKLGLNKVKEYFFMFLWSVFVWTFWRECYVGWFFTDLVSQKVATSFTALSLPLVHCGNAESILTLALLLCPLSLALTGFERNCEINLPVFHCVLQLSQTLIMNIWLTLLFHHYLFSILVPAKLGPFFLHL